MLFNGSKCGRWHNRTTKYLLTFTKNATSNTTRLRARTFKK